MQTVRVLLLVVGLPNALALFGLVVPAVPVPRGPAGFSVLGEMILLLAVAVAFAVVFMRLRFPGGLLFGALAGSAILHGSGLVHAALPWWIGSASVVTLGALVGSRFANTSARMLLAHLGAAFGSFAVSMADLGGRRCGAPGCDEASLRAYSASWCRADGGGGSLRRQRAFLERQSKPLPDIDQGFS